MINPILFYRVLTTQHKIFFKMTIFKFKELACFQTININFMKSKIFRNSTNKKIMIFCGKRKNLDFWKSKILMISVLKILWKHEVLLFNNKNALLKTEATMIFLKEIWCCKMKFKQKTNKKKTRKIVMQLSQTGKTIISLSQNEYKNNFIKYNL